MPAESTIGRVVATELKPSTPHQFWFWTARDAAVGIGAIVRVESPRTDGVRRGHRRVRLLRSDDPSPRGDRGRRRSRRQRDSSRPSAPRSGFSSAAVLRQVPEEPLQPVPLGAVHLATDADVRLALRMDGYTDRERATGIPVGIYAAGGLESPVYLDCDFLLGPEAAHLNISGVSGLATKTSAVEFLLASVFQTFPAHKGSVAALCLNVKGPDLCFLDQPGSITDEDGGSTPARPAGRAVQ